MVLVISQFTVTDTIKEC